MNLVDAGIFIGSLATLSAQIWIAALTWKRSNIASVASALIGIVAGVVAWRSGLRRPLQLLCVGFGLVVASIAISPLLIQQDWAITAAHGSPIDSRVADRVTAVIQHRADQLNRGWWNDASYLGSGEWELVFRGSVPDEARARRVLTQHSKLQLMQIVSSADTVDDLDRSEGGGE